jgi:hypothetical protein
MSFMVGRDLFPVVGVNGAELVQALLHTRAEVFLNPGVGGGQPLGFVDAANLSFHACGVAGEAQEVVAGELNEECAVDFSLE